MENLLETLMFKPFILGFLEKGIRLYEKKIASVI